MKYLLWWWREFRRSPATLYKQLGNRGIFTTNPSTGAVRLISKPTTGKDGRLPTESFFQGLLCMSISERPAKVLTYTKKAWNLAKFSYFTNLPTHCQYHGHAEIQISPTCMFSWNKGIPHFPSKKSYAQVVFSVATIRLAFRLRFLRLAFLPGTPGKSTATLGLDAPGS